MQKPELKVIKQLDLLEVIKYIQFKLEEEGHEFDESLWVNPKSKTFRDRIFHQLFEMHVFSNGTSFTLNLNDSYLEGEMKLFVNKVKKLYDIPENVINMRVSW